MRKDVIISAHKHSSKHARLRYNPASILGSSNEANLFYQQMRRTLAYAIMNRIASKEVTNIVNAAFATKPKLQNMKLTYFSWSNILQKPLRRYLYH